MPRVPQYQEGQVQHRNLPSAGFSNLPSAAFGADIGRGLQDVAGVVGQIAEQEREKADTAQLLEADRELSAWEVQALYTPETGALNRRGKDALGLPDQLLPDYDSRVSAIVARLNPRIAQRFQALAAGRRDDIQKALFRHVSEQGDFILKSEAEAYEATSLAAIAANADDPERVAAEQDRLWASKLATLTRLGATPEIIRAERAGLEAKVHSTLLDQYLAARDYPKAIAYYEANREALGERADEYGKQVEQARLIYEETATADRLIGQFGAGPAAIAQAKLIEDPVLRERVESRIDREAARRERLRNEGERITREQAWAKLEQAPPTADLYEILTPRELAALSAMPGVLAQMEGRQNARLRGLEVKTDPTVFDELHRSMATDPQGFAQTDLTKFYDKLSPADRDYFRKAQADMANPAKIADAATESQQLATYVWGPLGIPSSGAKGADRRGAFMQAYFAEKEAFIAANGGRAPNDRERKEIMQRLMLPFVRNDMVPGWWDEERRAFEVPRGQEAQFRAVVPPADRQQIIESFQRNLGRMPTELEIADLYNRAQGN